MIHWARLRSSYLSKCPCRMLTVHRAIRPPSLRCSLPKFGDVYTGTRVAIAANVYREAMRLYAVGVTRVWRGLVLPNVTGCFKTLFRLDHCPRLDAVLFDESEQCRAMREERDSCVSWSRYECWTVRVKVDCNLPSVWLVHEGDTSESHTTKETDVPHVLPVLLLSLASLGNL